MNIEDKFKQILDNIARAEEAYTKICVLGQPGAGKSSLINNVLGKKVAKVGVETDVTREIEGYALDFMKIYDTPGYGTKDFKYEDWQNMFKSEHFDVVIFVFSGKLAEADDKLLQELNKYDTPVFFVRNYADSFMEEDDREAVLQDFHKHLQEQTKLYFTSCGREKEGIEELRRDILNPEFKDIWKNRVLAAFAKAKTDYLAKAQAKAEEDISTYKKAAAVNGLNPIPGIDIAVDLGVYFKMFDNIKEDYSIDKSDLTKYLGIPIAKSLMSMMTKEGLLFFLKRYATKYASQKVAKYLPVIGSAISFTLGWQLCKYAGEEYSKECYTFADEVLERLITQKSKELLEGI